MRTIVLLLIALTLPACATFSNPGSSQAVLESAGRTYATVKVIKEADNPEVRANRMRSILADVSGFLDKADTSNSTLETLDAAMQAYLMGLDLDAEEVFLFDTLRRAVMTDLRARMGDASGFLTQEQVDAVRIVLGDIRFGIEMAGY